jgi:hypothetical protein
LVNGWAASTVAPAYSKDGAGFVHLQGLASGSGASATTITTLPSGYRPAVTVQAYAQADGATVSSNVVTITTGGVITAQYGSGKFVSFDMIAPFLAA